MSDINRGNLNNNTAPPLGINLGVLPAIANAAAPTYVEGNQVLLSTDLAGNVRVTGSISVGGTTDNSAYTAGSSTGTPSFGFFHSTIDAVTDGHAAALAIDAKRNLFTVLRDAAGNARGVNVTAGNALTVDGSASTQPVSGTVTANAGTNLNTSTLALETGGNLATVAGAVIAQEATTSGVKGVTIFGAVTTAAPTYTTAKSDALSLDTSGLLRVSLKDTPANTNNLNVNLAASAATVTVSGTVTTTPPANASTNLAQIVGSAASTAATGVLLVGNADGAGNKLTTNSTTYTAKFGLDGNLLGTLGTAFSTAGKVDVKGADGDVFVRQTTAANLNATIVGTGTLAVQPSPTATATGLTIYNNTALVATAVAVKASAGRWHKYNVYNPNTVVIYLQVWNLGTGSITVGTTAPTEVYAIPALGWWDGYWESSSNWSTAISIAATTTATGLTAPTTGLLVNLGYI